MLHCGWPASHLLTAYSVLFRATTHNDLQMRAQQEGIQVTVIHNASIMNAVGACGLQLYKYGEVSLQTGVWLRQRAHGLSAYMKSFILTKHVKEVAWLPLQAVSIVFFTETWRPDSFYDRILANRRMGSHTLCLLDIKVKEPSLESLARGKKVYEPPRFMTVNTAVEQLLEVERNRKAGAYGPDTLAVGLARLGADSQQLVAGTMQQLLEVDFGAPLHSLVLPGALHDMERESLKQFQLQS